MHDDEDISTFWRHYSALQDGALREERKWAEMADNPLAFSLLTLQREDPVGAWGIIMKLVETAPDAAALCYLGAGPLEELILEGGPELAAQIYKQARMDDRLRVALQCVDLPATS